MKYSLCGFKKEAQGSLERGNALQLDEQPVLINVKRVTVIADQDRFFYTIMKN